MAAISFLNLDPNMLTLVKTDVEFGDEEAILYHLNFLQRINLKLDQMPKA